MKEMERKISMAVIRRLPKYLRYLKDLMDEGVVRTSSQELSELTGFTASQIRQDLNNFGGFGQQGYGYNVESLYEEIRKIIGLDKSYSMVIVGIGNLGRALARNGNFSRNGFKIVGLFDPADSVIGRDLNGVIVQDIQKLPAFLAENKVDMGVITTPREVSQTLADVLVEGGVSGILNFTPVDLQVPETVVVENLQVVDSLMTLAYHMKDRDDD